MERSRVVGLTLLVFLATVIECGLLLPHLARDLVEQAWLTLVAYAVTGVAFGGLLVWLWLAPRAQDWRWSVPVILLAGLIFRATVWPLEPALSQDVQRFRWEGLVLAAGFDPFAYPPNAPELAPLAEERADIYERLEPDHRHIPTIYPPTLQGLFWLNAVLFDGALWGWKAILVAFDVLLLGAVWSMLPKSGAPLLGLAAIWWCPLLLIETYVEGHVDLIGVALLAAACALVVRARGVLAAVLLALSMNVKYLWPALGALVLLPALRSQHKLARSLAVLMLVLVVAWLPFISGLQQGGQTARAFLDHWHFNDYFFGQLRALYPPKSTMPLVIAGTVVVTAAVVLIVVPPRRLWHDVWLLSGTALLLSPVGFPWYYLWIVPALAIRPPPWAVVWVLVAPAAHITHYVYMSTGYFYRDEQFTAALGTTVALLLLCAWLWRLLVQPCLTPPGVAHPIAHAGVPRHA